MLKTIFWLLLIANGVLLALQVNADTPVSLREPQRLRAQLHPERIVLVATVDGQPAAGTTAAAAASSATAPAAATPAVTAPAAPTPAAATAPAATPVAATPVPATSSTATPSTTTRPAAAAPAVSTTVPVASPVAAPVAANVAATPPSRAAAPLAPAAVAQAPIACLEFGDFSVTDARRFERQLAALAPDLHPVQRVVQEVANYMVYIPSQGSKEGADRKAAELQRLHIEDFYILNDPPSLRWAISLGVFKTEQAAKTQIARLIQTGVRSANILARPASSGKVALQLHDIPAALKSDLEGLKASFPAQQSRACAA